MFTKIKEKLTGTSSSKYLKDADSMKDGSIESICCKAMKESKGLTPYPVQIAASMALLDGKLVEMKTGEGKTLTIALSAAIQALVLKAVEGSEGRSRVYIATSNDYLAKRDMEEMKPFFDKVGLNVSVSHSGMTVEDKKNAHKADVIYSTPQEIGFDFLRDKIVPHPDARTIGLLSKDSIIADEADTVLIDEATTPMILSGVPSSQNHVFNVLFGLIESFEEGTHYTVDRENMIVEMTDEAVDITDSAYEQESIKGIFTNAGFEYVDYHDGILCCLMAINLYREDHEYIVRDGKIIIVDESTGRAQDGRRWSNMIHQAIEYKHGMTVFADAPVLAQASMQTVIDQFKYVSGISGTLKSIENELEETYQKSVVVIPTHKACIRKDLSDQIFGSKQSKLKAICARASKAKKAGQPVLISTSSIQESEDVSSYLNSEGVDHILLNAKNAEEESKIISQAGRKGRITIATQMAGRGTDIILGGTVDMHENESEWKKEREDVIHLGGLLVIGASRSISRRVDDQLRGRSGRQGEPGESQFFVSVEDELVLDFGDKKMKSLIDEMELEDGQAIEGKMLNKLIETAQTRRENADRNVRIDNSKYDAIMRNQMNVFYFKRDCILEMLVNGLEGKESNEDVKDYILDSIRESAVQMIDESMENDSVNAAKLTQLIASRWNLGTSESMYEGVDYEKLCESVTNMGNQYFSHREGIIGEDKAKYFYHACVLQGMDQSWGYFLKECEMLRKGVNLRKVANENPRIAYQKESYKLFDLIDTEAMIIAGNAILGSHIPTRKIQQEEVAA